jgi:hypothetical protein
MLFPEYVDAALRGADTGLIGVVNQDKMAGKARQRTDVLRAERGSQRGGRVENPMLCRAMRSR